MIFVEKSIYMGHVQNSVTSSPLELKNGSTGLLNTYNLFLLLYVIKRRLEIKFITLLLLKHVVGIRFL